MMEMFVLIKGEPSEPYVCGSQAADRTFLLAAEEPLQWINKREIGWGWHSPFGVTYSRAGQKHDIIIVNK